MLRVTTAAVLMIILTGVLSCGTSAPAGPEEIAQSILEAAQSGEFDKMMSYMSVELQREFDEAMLSRIEIVSFSIDEIDYDSDSTEAEIEYTITIKEITSGELDTDDQDMELELNSDGVWIVVDI